MTGWLRIIDKLYHGGSGVVKRASDNSQSASPFLPSVLPSAGSTCVGWAPHWVRASLADLLQQFVAPADRDSWPCWSRTQPSDLQLDFVLFWHQAIRLVVGAQQSLTFR
jgi:hypothetical protein